MKMDPYTQKELERKVICEKKEKQKDAEQGIEIYNKSLFWYNCSFYHQMDECVELMVPAPPK